jgi:multisubunit Na+/H+ antiporter MnhG subunit
MSLVIAAVALHRFTEFLRRLGSIATGTGGVAVLIVSGTVAPRRHRRRCTSHLGAVLTPFDLNA